MLANLRRTLHARDEFFLAASHELRTQLTALGLQTEGLLHPYRLDVMMPDMNGWQIREAQQRDARIPDIPLVVITASRALVSNRSG